MAESVFLLTVDTAGAIALVLAIAALLARPAEAHGPAEAAAALLDPDRPGVVVSESYTFRWADLGTGSTSGTGLTYQRFYFGTEHVAPWYPWTVPPAPPGELIVDGILDSDPTNSFTWDTRRVPAGAYWLFSLADDADIALPGSTLRFSPFPVIIARAGEPVSPAVVLLEPNTSYDYADGQFEIVWSAFDPDGTGRVTIEASSSTDAASLRTIARDLPASNSKYLWDTHAVPEGDYVLRATIEDARGFRFSAFARFFLLVSRKPPDGARPDAGLAPDSGLPDASAAPSEPVSSNAACTHALAKRGGTNALTFVVILAALLVSRFRRHSPKLTTRRSPPGDSPHA